ncbi:Type 1 glutamine amidotransferase-like domain-containing protein [Lysinibacillus xylanilyticus]|uniref:Type 1 glutamine amidotransferase-like domain-containing protein n=1 Tax=Lysinibacillus xylanilyticus TaxID=582475 RepID=UPI003D0301E0
MKQIIALGGGGFSMEPHNPLLDTYILQQSNKANPKICFVPTASGDSENYISRFYSFFDSHQCIPSHLSLFSPPTQDLESFILEKDIIYVGGGNTKNLLALWKEWSLDRIFKTAWHEGILLTGISAGSICWFEEGITDSYCGGNLQPINCLGFLPGSNCPHYDGEINRKPAYHDLVQAKKLSSGLAVDDGVAVHFIDQEIHKIVSSKPNGKAYRVSLDEGIKEQELSVEYLGSM